MIERINRIRSNSDDVQHSLRLPKNFRTLTPRIIREITCRMRFGYLESRLRCSLVLGVSGRLGNENGCGGFPRAFAVCSPLT